MFQYNVQYSVQVKSGFKMRQDLFGCLILLLTFNYLKLTMQAIVVKLSLV